jgi:hypothetical protein
MDPFLVNSYMYAIQKIQFKMNFPEMNENTSDISVL